MRDNVRDFFVFQGTRRTVRPPPAIKIHLFPLWLDGGRCDSFASERIVLRWSTCMDQLRDNFASTRVYGVNYCAPPLCLFVVGQTGLEFVRLGKLLVDITSLGNNK